MVRYTILGVADGIAIIIGFKVMNLYPNETFLLAFFVAAFFAGLMADYGQGVWAGFFSTILFPLIWAPHLAIAGNPTGWFFVFLFFLILGIVAGIIGCIIGIIGNVVGERIFLYRREVLDNKSSAFEVNG
ncbi:MAG: hypothetical protein ABIH76_01410 [Candidatus Bathyarchaeota archaeon]